MNKHAEFQELVALAQLYLKQEYPKKTWVQAAPDTVVYFRQYATRARSEPRQLPTQPLIPQRSVVEPKPISAPRPLEQPVVKEATATEEPVPKKPASPITPAVEKKSEDTIKQPFKREPVEKIQKPAIEELKKDLQQQFPHIRFKEEIPSDAEAVKLTTLYKTQTPLPAVLVLVNNESAEGTDLLQKLAAAITERYVPAELRELHTFKSEAAWQSLTTSTAVKLVLTTQKTINSLPQLQKQAQPSVVHTPGMLLDKTLILIADTTHYLRDPQLKKQLWKSICDQLSRSVHG